MVHVTTSQCRRSLTLILRDAKAVVINSLPPTPTPPKKTANKQKKNILYNLESVTIFQTV